MASGVTLAEAMSIALISFSVNTVSRSYETIVAWALWIDRRYQSMEAGKDKGEKEKLEKEEEEEGKVKVKEEKKKRENIACMMQYDVGVARDCYCYATL